MSGNKRLMRDVRDILTSNRKDIRALDTDLGSLNVRNYLLLPTLEPYNERAFCVSLEFTQYPEKAPNVCIKTKMYHPNVRDNGQVCLHMLTDAGWKPGVTILELLDEILKLINEPQLDRPANQEIAAQYQQRREEFNKAAQEHVRKYGETRPE
uniref:UBC core domain-containing protein n=1 Tax=Acrobeloides nanus TaxID=290746 RepID=A0A914CA04_9BILA